MRTDAEKAAKYDKLWAAYQKQNERLKKAQADLVELAETATEEIAKLQADWLDDLYDRFAAAALTGILANPREDDATTKQVACAAFDMADAMLEMKDANDAEELSE
jgi:hypothetical protein